MRLQLIQKKDYKDIIVKTQTKKMSDNIPLFNTLNLYFGIQTIRHRQFHIVCDN